MPPRCSVLGSIPCPEQCDSLKVLLQDPASRLGHLTASMPLGLGPQVRISEAFLLLSGAFLSKFLGNNCEGLMITLLSHLSLISTSLGYKCAVVPLCSLSPGKKLTSLPWCVAGLGKVRKHDSCVLLIKMLQKFPVSPAQYCNKYTSV